MTDASPDEQRQESGRLPFGLAAFEAFVTVLGLVDRGLSDGPLG